MSQLFSLFIETKYSKLYIKIIENAEKRLFIEGDVESHHKIPKSCGGSNSIDNLVKLTPKEHFIVHLLLAKSTYHNPKHKKSMLWAFFIMSGKKQHCSKLYQKIKLSLKRNGIDHPMYGRKHKSISRQRMSEKRKIPCSDIRRDSISKYWEVISPKLETFHIKNLPCFSSWNVLLCAHLDTQSVQEYSF